MSRWETTSTLDADVSPAAVWTKAYANAAAWPKWNAEIKRASLDGPLALGAKAKIVFGTGLRLRFHVVEFEDGRLFTDESRLPGARMGHRHLVEPTTDGGSRLTNTIYIEGPLSPLWRRILGPAAARSLPDAQRAIVSFVASPPPSHGPRLPRRNFGCTVAVGPSNERNPMPTEVKNFDSPDETRPFEGNGQAKIVQLAGHAVARGTFEPGWKWSENVKPIAGTDSCQVAHFGYVLSGSMRVFMDDGTEAEVKAGDVFAIPPGHDAEVPGPEACVMVDFGEIGNYAKRD